VNDDRADRNHVDGPEAAYLRRRAEMLRLLERRLRATEDGAPSEDAAALAERAYLSRFHFGRVFRRVVGEPPGEMERRLRLERAAHALRATSEGVTGIAFDAGYDSLEGFSRAFRRAYGLSPSRFRALAAPPPFLPGASGVHYDTRTRGLRVSPNQGEPPMDLTDRLIDNDYWAKKRFLGTALVLTDAQLDAPLAFRHNLMPFVEPERTLREALGRMTGDGWVLGMMDAAGWPSAAGTPRTGWQGAGDDQRRIANHAVSDMISRLDSFQKDYAAFVQKVKAEDLWETQWVDAACEPPETFTYGTTIEATLTWGIAQRMVVQRLLEQIGLSPDAAAV